MTEEWPTYEQDEIRWARPGIILQGCIKHFLCRECLHFFDTQQEMPTCSKCGGGMGELRALEKLTVETLQEDKKLLEEETAGRKKPDKLRVCWWTRCARGIWDWVRSWWPKGRKS